MRDFLRRGSREDALGPALSDGPEAFAAEPLIRPLEAPPIDPFAASARPNMDATASVSTAMESVHGRIPELVSQYTDPSSWMRLFGTIASWLVVIYNKFERDSAKEIEQLLPRVQRAMDHLTEDAAERYRKAEDEARNRLRKAIRAAHIGTSRTLRAHTQRLTQLRKIRPTLAGNAGVLKVALAGDANARIDIPISTRNSTILKSAAATGAVIFVMGVEYLTGFGMWKWMSDQDIATGTSIVTVIGLTLLTFFTVRDLRRYVAWRDAVRTYKRLYPNGHESGYRVDDFSTGHKIMALGGLTFLLVLSGLLLGSRWLIVGQGFDQSGLIGAVVLLTTVLIYALIDFRIEEPYTAEQYASLAKATDALDEIDGEINELAAAPPAYQEERDQAIEAYNAAMTDVEGAELAVIDDLEDARAKLVDLLVNYNGTWDRFLAEFRDDCNDLIKQVVEAWHPESGFEQFSDPSYNIRVTELFTNAVMRRYDKPELLQRLQQHRFVAVDLPDIRLTEFKTVEEDALRAMNAPLLGGVETTRTAGTV